MKLPKRLKVGGFYYDIEVTDEPLILNHKQCKGLIDYEHQKISIAGESVQGIQGQWQSLFHELVHAFRHSRNLDWGEKDELYTEEISLALHAFFVDNGLIEKLAEE